MKKSMVIIEIGDTGGYSVYINNDSLSYHIHGNGETVEAAKKDFLVAYDGMKEYYKNAKKNFQETLFEYKYDVESFFNYYSKIFSMPALEKLTGINQKQLHHYASGIRKPRQAQIMKIEKSMHKLGKELLAVHF